MNIANILCNKSTINQLDNWNQQRFLLVQLCDHNYRFMNLSLVDFEYFQQNAIFLLIVLFITIPVCVVSMYYMAKRYLSSSLILLSNLHKKGRGVSAAFILGPILNYRIFVSSYRQSKIYTSQQVQYSKILGSILGIFCMSIFYIFIKKKTSTKFKKHSINFNIYFLILCVILINVLMAIQISTLYKFIILLVMYCLYIVGVLYNEKQESLVQLEFAYNDEEQSDDEALQSEEEEEEEDYDQTANRITLDKDQNTKNQGKTFLNMKRKQIEEELKNKGLLEKIVSIYIFVPIRIYCRFFVSSKQNPWMETQYKFFIVLLSSVNAFFFFNFLFDSSINLYTIIVLFIFLLGYSLYTNSERGRKVVYEVIGLLSIMRIIAFFLQLLHDQMFFLLYYINFDATIGNGIIIIIPYLILQVQTLGAIARQRELKLALLSVFGDCINKILLTYADSFFQYWKGGQNDYRVYSFAQEAEVNIIQKIFVPYEKYFIITSLMIVVILMLFKVQMTQRDYVLTKTTGIVFMMIFSMCFLVSAIYATFIQLNNH